MQDSYSEREQQQFDRVCYRFKPESKTPDLLAEKLTAYHLYDITEPAAEQCSPEHSRYSAVPEHCKSLAHTFFELEFL